MGATPAGSGQTLHDVDASVDDEGVASLDTASAAGTDMLEVDDEQFDNGAEDGMVVGEEEWDADWSDSDSDSSTDSETTSTGSDTDTSPRTGGDDTEDESWDGDSHTSGESYDSSGNFVPV
jgi:hypothetical protein